MLVSHDFRRTENISNVLIGQMFETVQSSKWVISFFDLTYLITSAKEHGEEATAPRRCC